MCYEETMQTIKKEQLNDTQNKLLKYEMTILFYKLQNKFPQKQRKAARFQKKPKNNQKQIENQSAYLCFTDMTKAFNIELYPVYLYWIAQAVMIQ